MFGIGLPELIIILIVALIVFGPRKLPDLAKSLGKGIAEFKKATDDFKSSIESDTRVDLDKAETYTPEVSSQDETHTSSAVPPPELIAPPASPMATADPNQIPEDSERERTEIAALSESAPSEAEKVEPTPWTKEETQPGTPKKSV